MADRDDATLLEQDWSPEDDAMIRRALGSLRTDVDAVPLADVRFVKARGAGRRRRRALVWTAGAAAAVVVAGAVGFQALGDRGPGESLPAGPTQTTSAPAVPGMTSEAGLLPVGGEWTERLGASPALETASLKEFDSVDCMPTFPGEPDLAQGVDVPGDPGAAGFQGTQAHFTTGSAAAGTAGAQAIVDDLTACANAPIEVTVVPGGAAGSPTVLSYSAENGGGGYYVVAHAGRDVAYLSLSGVGGTTPELTAEQVRGLAAIAQERLATYGADGTDPVVSGSPTGAPTGTATGEPTSGSTGGTGGSGGPVAVDEEMPVVPDATYPSALFVAASQWSSQGLTQGRATEAGTGEYEGSAAIASCDVDTEATGNFGIVSVRDADGFIGKQRVRGATSIGDSDQRVQALEDGFAAGCTFANGTVTAEPGPSERTWKLTTDFAEGNIDRDVVEYVAVTPFDESLISTIVITDPPADEATAFAELDRLVALAVQK